MSKSIYNIGIIVCGLVFAYMSETSADEEFFQSHVVPVLEQRCLSCHNSQDLKGEFSIESAETAFADGYIEPGDSAASHLIDLITPVNGKAEMPKASDPLSKEDLATIRQWIDKGAKWPEGLKLSPPEVADLDWWSLSPLHKPEIPLAEVSQNRQLKIRTPIDAFIQKQLSEKGLNASAEADRLTLIRRLYFDLIGLPPTPEEISAFLEDRSPNAYEHLVDRLLDSNHYGERWARHWLDVVHYADTHGYDKDKLRPHAWPYRDYVIRSFNEDKPYSRFVKEQVAGDALWPNTLDGITATGFISAGPWDFIGHAEVPETKIDGKIARHLDRDDMVTSTMNSFCSTTVQCARCHNHKFDPVTQEHYYSLQAVFAALDRADREFDADPGIATRRAELQRELKNMTAQRKELNEAVEKAAGEELVAINSKIKDLRKVSKNKMKPKPEFGYHSQIARSPDEVKWVQVDLGEITTVTDISYVGCHDDFNGIGHGFGFPVRYKIETCLEPEFRSDVRIVVDHTSADMENPGTEEQTVRLNEGVMARYIRFTATRLAERKEDYIFALAELQVFDASGENVSSGKTVTALDSIEAPVRWQKKNLVDGYHFALTTNTKLEKQIADLQSDRDILLESTKTEEQKRNLREITRLTRSVESSLKDLPALQKVYCGTVHTGKGSFVGTGAQGGKPRTIHVLHRGKILDTREEVGPGTIPFISEQDWKFQLPEGHSESDRRVALANWIVDKNNPLTWRSIVNRVWQYHFGRGLVDTPNDFGRMGQLPTHPELLDWLAMEFRDGGQSMKRLHKMIVMSSVYRQASSFDEANNQIDSQNNYLWRMNRRRLTAEELRDAVLSVSGKLDTSMYGPGFQLFKIEHPEHSPHYEYDQHDPDDPLSHRRTIYRFIVRSQPDPFMTTLDCADSSQSVPKRDETMTALQALSLLNNKFMLRMSECFSDRIKNEESTVEGQINLACQLVTGHLPSEEQHAKLMKYTEEHGTENLCRLLFNINEFVFID